MTWFILSVCLTVRRLLSVHLSVIHLRLYCQMDWGQTWVASLRSLWESTVCQGLYLTPFGHPSSPYHRSWVPQQSLPLMQDSYCAVADFIPTNMTETYRRDILYCTRWLAINRHDIFGRRINRKLKRSWLRHEITTINFSTYIQWRGCIQKRKGRVCFLSLY